MAMVASSGSPTWVSGVRETSSPQDFMGSDWSPMQARQVAVDRQPELYQLLGPGAGV